MISAETVKPAPSFGGMIPTLNQRGFMLPALDEYSQLFVDHCATARGEVLDIGCAYGIATKGALDRGARVCAVDMDPGHLEILEREVPVEQRARLRVSVGLLPDVEFAAQSFDAILAARVLHFLPGDDFDLALRKFRSWLRPGGKLFAITDTPYAGFWSASVPGYLERKRAGERWPGYIADIRPLFGARPMPEGMLPYMNLADIGTLRRAVSDAGFTIERSSAFGDASTGGAAHAGVVAVA